MDGDARAGKKGRAIRFVLVLVGVAGIGGLAGFLGGRSERARLEEEYRELVKEAGQVKLEQRPGVLDWRGEVEPVGQVVEMRGMRFRFPWEGEVVERGGELSGGGFRVSGISWEYGPGVFEERMQWQTKNVADQRQRQSGVKGLLQRGKEHWPNLRLLPDRGLTEVWPSIEPRQLRRAREDGRWAAYWGEYAERPWAWWKRTLETRPREDIREMQAGELEEYLSRLFRKALFLEAVPHMLVTGDAATRKAHLNPVSEMWLFETARYEGIIAYRGKINATVRCWEKGGTAEVLMNVAGAGLDELRVVIGSLVCEGEKEGAIDGGFE